MREILFRGKRKDNYEWCEGFYARYRNKHYIIEMVNELIVNWHEVFPDTVGQYTGLNDRNGKQIFEGDILRTDLCAETLTVIFNVYCATFQVLLPDGYSEGFCEQYSVTSHVKVIGNIHDNPELMEV